MGKLVCYDLGKRLGEARRCAGLSQEQVAQAANLSQTTVTRIEAGLVHPTVDTLERIARALRVSPSWLVFGEDAPGPAAARDHAVLARSAAALCEVLGFAPTGDVLRLAAQLDQIRGARTGTEAGLGEPGPTLH